MDYINIISLAKGFFFSPFNKVRKLFPIEGTEREREQMATLHMTCIKQNVAFNSKCQPLLLAFLAQMCSLDVQTSF